MRITPDQDEEWHRHLHTPVIFNPHKPIEINATTIEHVDLNQIRSTPDAVKNKERVLILTPLRDATSYLPQHFDLLTQLTYPHDLIDLAFLVGDSTDDTIANLAMELERIQGNEEIAFHSALIVEKNFGIKYSQDVKDRHSFKAQGPRRKAMGKARNVDIHDSPAEIIEDFVAHDRDILVPSECDLGGKVNTVADSEQISGSTGIMRRMVRWSTLKEDVRFVHCESGSPLLTFTSRLQLLARIA
jgi:hypothetical protein